MKASPTQKQREQSGTAGTASIHAGFRVPDTAPPIGNNREQTESAFFARLPVSVFVPAVPDAAKPIGNAEGIASQGMPLVPAVPDAKQDELQ